MTGCALHSTWKLGAVAACALALGCLSVDSVPVEDGEQPCAERTDPDPLVGAWESSSGRCEFFSNARYTDGCGVDLSGFPSDWAHLQDGRYYFGASSLGSPSGECLGVATFSDACESLSLQLECSRGTKRTLDLMRIE